MVPPPLLLVNPGDLRRRLLHSERAAPEGPPEFPIERGDGPNAAPLADGKRQKTALREQRKGIPQPVRPMQIVGLERHHPLHPAANEHPDGRRTPP